ncbi:MULTISPECIES: DUF2326 domain-containing protein [Bacillus]|uniref:DUF2326 domain-containing protein n=1 Tax=Bacillus TaxID=1386 RepID=UPI00227EC135|nr:DUF2326 domain-containing protein [Bacillus sonorensis]MCY8027259.1 DUF2326 domain-containing protein [Bacillus sonorensis]MDR4956976.1 DUF2326 domain-containing protein [Bacillus sonorensis]
MLAEIRSRIFKDEIIKFHQGLNVVLGDNQGSNSIGKSTLLMILDFIFGGNTYILHNKDVITKFGDHDFGCTFKFKKGTFYFIRSTKDPKLVYKSNQNFEKLEPIKLDSYRDFLKESYNLESEQLKFRSAVSTFSRVWGKNNYDVKRPLHNHHSEKNIETVIKLIKLFNEYDKIAKEDKELSKLDESKKVLNKAGKLDLIPKISKRKYEKNLKEIGFLKGQIEKLSKNAYSPLINLPDVVSDELVQLRVQKKKLIEEQDYYRSRLNRTTKKREISASINFENLLEFFPNINMKKLKTIEEFHNGINSILNKELINARKEIKEKLTSLSDEIIEINQKLEKILSQTEESNLFMDQIIEYSSELKNLQSENDHYNNLQNIRTSIVAKTTLLNKIKDEIVNGLKGNINVQLTEINNFIHENKRTAPELELKYSNYDYKFFENTGTGKAYTNLIIFDLAILRLTALPFIIHDSFLFKNIEKEVVERLITFYNSMSKQVFIAIDFINIYNQETQNILQANKVIQLTKNKLLTKIDWRNSSN